METLNLVVIFLVAAIIAVPISKRLGLGSVLGYLFAGMVIGPWGLGLVKDVDNILRLAELGVVFLLFLIGLELQPRRLWVMRKQVFGLGASQVIVTSLVLAGLLRVFGLSWTTAIVIGFSLSLSSTAFGLQMLAERKQLTTRFGRSAFAVLLFQDLAVIPALALLPLLDGGGTSAMTAAPIIKGLLAIVALIFVGRYLLQYVLVNVAKTDIAELFTAMSLLLVVGAALIMHSVGLSMALGAFLAGVLVADSNYRHVLAADIVPVKGLFLGLFFIAVGMSANLGLLSEQWALIGMLSVVLLAVKFLIILGLGLGSGLDARASLSLAATLPQGGEFAFVILAAAVSSALIAPDYAALAIVVVTVSMMATPPIFAAVEALQRRWQDKQQKQDYDEVTERENEIIIAGVGRVGQIVARILRAKGIGFTALDANPEQVELVRRYGNKVYFGDAARLDLLRAAGMSKAKIFVLAISNVEHSLHIAALVRQHFPNVKILARARNRKHAYRFMELGVMSVWRETFHTSLQMADQILIATGLTKQESHRVVEAFRVHDEERLAMDFGMHNDEEKMVYLARKSADELRELFEHDNELPAAGKVA